MGTHVYKLAIFVLLIKFMVSQYVVKNTQVYCDPNKRPDPNTCFGEGAVFKSLCAYYKNNCPFSICGQPVSNECQACSDPNVLYYKLGDCKPEEVVFQCFEDICNPDFDPQQGKVFEPVCGFTKICRNGDCSKTFDNVCQACKAKGYKWYQNGVCEDDRNYCSSKKLLLNSKTPVCAFFNSEDGGVLVHTTANNARAACKDPAVSFYTTGKCGPNRDDLVYCLPNSRPTICTRDYNPVCGFYLAETGELEHKIMSNPCTACSDPSIIYHKPGPCVFQCDRNPFVIYECIGSFVDPICGTYTDASGQTKRISLKNSCIGCYNIPIKIDSYTDGLCPGDEGIRCENDAGGFLTGIISPVCGVFVEGCTTESCQQTFSEPVVACSHPSVILFKPGMCPGDQGISCNPYRSQPLPESGDFFGSIIYNDVCAYSKEGCVDSSCRATYANQYEACGNPSVLFFTEGPCA